MKILGIDPGSSESGYVVYTPPAPVTIAGKIPNEQMLGMLETAKFDTVVIERPECWMTSKYLDETLIWVGRFFQSCKDHRTCKKIAYMTRDGVLRKLFGKAIRPKKGEPSRDERVKQLMLKSYESGSFPAPIFSGRKDRANDAWQAMGLVTAYLKEEV